MLLVAVSCLAAGYFASRAVLTQQVRPSDAPSASTAEVVEATIGQTLNVGVTVTQPSLVLASNTLTGVVTEVSPNTSYDVGTVIYRVANIPVWLVQGLVPLYRDLTVGVEGVDVQELQKALQSLGYSIYDKSGTYGTSTELAIKKRQKSLGVETTGTVRLGEIVAVPTLPAADSVGTSIKLGHVLVGGEDSVIGRSGIRQFSLVLTDEQAAALKPDSTISVKFNGAEWAAVVGSISTDENGSPTFVLAGINDAEVCGDQCAQLPAVDKMSLPGEIVITPPATGLAVPTSALRTDPNGKVSVVTKDRQIIPVEVVGIAQGLAVVVGLTAGQIVRLGS